MLKPASEMREKTKQNIENGISISEKLIAEEINSAASKGYHITYSPTYYAMEHRLKCVMKTKLEKLGYVVKEDWDQRENKGWVTISW